MNRISGHFTRVLYPHDMHIVDGIRSDLNSDGILCVRSGYSGFVIYGPYWPMASGLYVVQPRIISDDNEQILGVLELCDRGAVLASTELDVNTIMTAQLPGVKGLEIRIKANGTPFKLISLMVAHFPAGSNTRKHQGAVDHGAMIEGANDLLGSISRTGPHPQTLPGVLLPGQVGCDFNSLASALDRNSDRSVIERLACETLATELPAWMADRVAVQVIDAWGDKILENAELLEGLGFEPGYTRIAADDRHSLSALYADGVGAVHAGEKLRLEHESDYDPSQGLDWFPELQRVQGGFSKLAAMLGRAYTTCPFTCATLSTEHCIPVPHNGVKQVFLFYRFVSVCTFYVVVAGFSASKMFIYVPSKNVVLRLHAPLFEWGQPQHAVDQFTKLTLSNALHVHDYLNSATQLAAISGTMNNVGHFLWNEVSGVVKYATSGYLDIIQVGLLYEYDFIDPYLLLEDRLLPRRLKSRSEDELFHTVLSERLFCIKPVDCQISAAVADRIRQLSDKMSSPEQLRLATVARNHSYRLWVALRNHNKVWVNQVEALSIIIADLAKKHESVAVYVDGTPDCENYLVQLQELMPQNVEIFSGINVSIYETIMWSFHIDSYIATIGSGLTFVTWVAGKPGIAHSESHHLSQMGFWGDARSGVPLPLTPEASEITDIGDTMYCNYHIEPQVIVALMQKLQHGAVEPLP